MSSVRPLRQCDIGRKMDHGLGRGHHNLRRFIDSMRASFHFPFGPQEHTEYDAISMLSTLRLFSGG